MVPALRRVTNPGDANHQGTIFGGFILGVAMPRGLLTAEIKRQLEPFAVLVLLPMFFTFSGLNTQLTMVDNIGLAAVTLVILAGSVLAKGGACWAAARPRRGVRHRPGGACSAIAITSSCSGSAGPVS